MEQIFQLKLSGDLHAIADCARHGAELCMNAVRPFGQFPHLWFELQMISNMDALDHQHIVFSFDFTDRFRR